MDNFHTIVLSIAAVLLIILLTFIGILMGNQASNQTFPTEQNQCPDYWQISTNDATKGHCVIPDLKSKLNCGNLYDGGMLTADMSNPSITPGFASIKNTDNTIVNSINFNDAGWSGGVCAKRNWARKYQIEWDGISNYNSCT
jgi:hypothetical protein